MCMKLNLSGRTGLRPDSGRAPTLNDRAPAGLRPGSRILFSTGLRPGSGMMFSTGLRLGSGMAQNRHMFLLFIFLPSHSSASNSTSNHFLTAAVMLHTMLLLRVLHPRQAEQMQDKNGQKATRSVMPQHADDVQDLVAQSAHWYTESWPF